MLLINFEKYISETNPEFVYRVLKENILSFTLRAGDSISEAEISKYLNVSRTPIREALVHLKNESLIDVYPQKGTLVSLLDFNLIYEAEFARTMLEKEVIKIAINSFSSENLLELEKNLEIQKKVAEFPSSVLEFFNLDNKFHEIIFKGCNKINTWEKIKTLSSHLNRIRLLDATERTNHKVILEQHQEIINIIKNKDLLKAEETIKNHISNFKIQLDFIYSKYPEFFKVI